MKISIQICRNVYVLMQFGSSFVYFISHLYTSYKMRFAKIKKVQII